VNTSNLPPESCNLRILVVDDDQLVADSLAMVLNFSGFVAVATYSGKEAVDLARLGNFDVLMTDVMMEPMNGIQAALEIRNLKPSCRVMLFSGNQRTAELLHEAHSAGHEFEILAKPVHPSVVLHRLHALGLPN